MARGVNKAILLGNIGRDPESRVTTSGKAVCNVSVATTKSWRDRESNEQRERTEWHRVVFFDRLAEIASEYLHKGSKVYIEGELQTNTWERDGQKHYTTEIVAKEMQMLDSKGDADSSYARPAEGSSSAEGSTQKTAEGSSHKTAEGSTQKTADGSTQKATAGSPGDDFDDDIPF